jgi:hypothetical protein
MLVEEDYLHDLEVFVFNCVYTPRRLYTLKECKLLHIGECRGGNTPPARSGGKRVLDGDSRDNVS